MVKIAINGFGRIGRQVLRRIIEKNPGVQVVAINDLTDVKTLNHLFKYDSSYGICEKDPGLGKKIKVFSQKDPAKLPWKKLGVDVVLECTGAFRDYEGASKHLKAGAKKVVISAPSKSPDKIPSYVLGLNEKEYTSKDVIVDMASCTTNCLAMMVKVLGDNFGIDKGFMTTAHSYTNDQRILDLPHKDLRRARTAAVNIIPTTTGAAKAIGRVHPASEGRLDGISLRVPTPTVSVVDLICIVKKKTDVKAVNDAFKKAAKSPALSKYLKATEEPLVSIDFKGDSHSAIVDLPMTMVNDDLVKVLAWYDNEWGYSCRLAEFAGYVGKKK